MTEQRSPDRRLVAGLPVPESAALLLYCCVQMWMAFVHEPWGDEAQAWLLARDNSLWDLFYRRLHYEGTPGLWHLLLWTETRLGVTYRGMHILTSAIAAVGVYLLLRYAPLPRALKLLFPFTFALLYQGPVVARSYLLTLPLMAALSVLRRKEPQNSLLYAALLGLLVNTSALGALLAIGLLIEWAYSAIRERWPLQKKSFAQAALVTLLLWSAALYTILPAPDAHFGFLGSIATRPAAARVLAKLTGTSVPPERSSVAQEPASAVQTIPAKPQPKRTWLQQKLYRMVFPTSKVTLFAHLLRYGLLVSFALYAISPSNVLALIFYGLLAWWLVRHHSLRFALPFALLCIIGPKLYISAHHAMVWWFALLGLVWMAWPNSTGRETKRIDVAFQTVLLLVLLQQVVFAMHAVYFDTREPFDGGHAAERFAVSKAGGGAIARFTFFPVSLEPYSRVNLFNNRPTTYEQWNQQSITLPISSVRAARPAIVVIGESFAGTSTFDNQVVPQLVAGQMLDAGAERAYLQTHGYVETHRFCGDQPINLGTYERVCQVIFEPAPKM